MKKPKSILKTLASIRLAIFIILSLAIVSAVGTITEARYDDEVAQKLVYQSVYMYAVLGLLIVTLISVMIDRWPWKPHHAGFVLAHIGIIILLFGAWLTQKYGVDGSLSFGVGDSRNTVIVKDRNLSVYSSLNGDSFREMYSAPADFLRHPPTPEKPFVISLGADELRFVQYEHFAFRESQITETNLERDGPAIRFQLENPNVNLTEWIKKDGRRPFTEIDLGPAKVVLTDHEIGPSGRNEVILVTTTGLPTLRYLIFNKDKSLRKKGEVKQSETIETGWMGLKFRLLRYLPRAKETVTYVKSPTASPASTSALRFTFHGQEYWLGLDTALRVYLEDRMFLLSYGHAQLQLKFPLTLKDFRIGLDQGTQHAATYESVVEVPEKGEVTISMNEPLKYQGFTFYQSSFEKDPKTGKPTASILSVNYDPGRWIKYLGSMLMVLGSIVLFYFKRSQWFKMRSSQ